MKYRPQSRPAVEQQSAATGEIARNVEQASIGTGEVSANIMTVEQAAGETGAAANQIRNSATDLSRQAEVLKTEVNMFLDQVRADKAHMKLIEWSDDIICGVPAVDRDHRHLVDLLNKAYGQMMTGEAAEAGIELVEALGELIERHFADEERIMARIDYPALADHKRIHKELVERFLQLKSEMEQGKGDAAQKLFTFLAQWLKDHTYKQDKAFVLFAKKNGKTADVMAA